MSELNLTHSNGNKVKLTTPDTLAANKTFKLPGADGTSGQFLKTDGSGALSFTSETANDFVKISTTTISSSVGDVVFDFDTSTYSQIFIFIEGLKLVSDSNIYARFKVSGTEITSANYNSSTVKKHSGGFDSNTYGGQDQTYMYLTHNIGATGGERYNAQMRLMLGSGTGQSFMDFTSYYRDAAGNYAGNFGSAGYQPIAQVDGLRIYSGANFDGGKFTVYGLK